MGWSSSSFEIEKSQENIIDDQRDEDVMKLMRIRMSDNKEKEIENNDLIKIKNLGDDLDENNKEEKTNDLINLENNDNDKKNKKIIFNDTENNEEIGEEINDKKILKNQHNNKEENNNNDNEENDKEENVEINHPEEKEENNETSKLFSNNASKRNISIIDKYFKSRKMNKSFFKKSSTKTDTKINKEPFTLKTTRTDSINLTTLKINASFFLREYLIPIWFEKDAFIKFNTTGKWRIDKTCDYTDTKGMPTPYTLDYNYGACIARIGSGEPFVILPNGFTYITKNEGPLYLKMNLPRKLKVYPEGEIEITIYDGEVFPLGEIYRKIGWKENNMKYGNNEGSNMENELMTTINNLRINPILFYEKYFRDVKNILWIEKFLQEKETKKNKIPFLPNDNCYNLLNRYIKNNYVNKTNINKQKVSLYLNEMKETLELYLNTEFKYKNFINCKLTQKYKPSDICFQYLLDKKYRNFIFNNEYNYITVKIIENYIDESNLVVIGLSKINESYKDSEENKEKDIN
mgnify:CR=1 FL=1